MNINEFHQEIQQVFIHAFEEWDEYEINDTNEEAPSIEDKFESIALECANKVVKIATRTRKPKAMLADALLEIVENYIDKMHEYDDAGDYDPAGIMGNVARMMGKLCQKLLTEAQEAHAKKTS